MSLASKKSATYLSFVLILLVGFVLASAAQAQSPVGAWTFDDGTGTSASDSSGNRYNATLINGVGWLPGLIDYAVSADALKKQYVSIPPIDLSGTQAVTVTLWSNRSYSTSGGHVLFVNSADFSNSTTGFGLFPDDATCSGIQVALRGNVGPTENCYSQPSSEVWHHLAAVFDKSQTGGNEIQLYVDGVLQTVNRSLQASTNTNNFANNPIFLFSRAGATEFDSGTVDDLRIYNSALTTSQIQQIYNSGILVSLAVRPTGPTIAVGTQQQFTAIGTYKDGSKKDLSSSVKWTPSVASIATVSGRGMATAQAVGSSTIQASLGKVKNSAALTVAPAALVSLAVTPATSSISVGQKQQFTATGTYSDGSHQNLTGVATWTSSTPTVATITGSGGISLSAPGLATGVASGSTTIQATSGSISGYANLSVTAAALVSIAVTPANASIAAGQQQQFTATGTYTDGSHQNLTGTAAWTSSAPSVATVSAGLATGVAAGSTAIQAISGSISGSTGLTVTAPTLVSIAVTPTSPSIAVGQQQQFTATGTYTNGSHQNLTGTAIWTSTSTSVATVSGGLATGVTAGSTTIQAASGSISGSTTLTVMRSQPFIALSWTASTSSGVVGYNAYRSLTSGGSYLLLNSGLIASTSYTDGTVQSGVTYYYATTAVDSQGIESAYSNQAAANVP